MSLAHAMSPSFSRATRVLYGISLLKLSKSAKECVLVQPYLNGSEEGYMVRVVSGPFLNPRFWTFAVNTEGLMVLRRYQTPEYALKLRGQHVHSAESAEVFQKDSALQKVLQREVLQRAREVAKAYETTLDEVRGGAQ